MKTASKTRIRPLKPILALQFVLGSASAQNYLQGDALRETYQLDGLGVIGQEIAGEISCAQDSSEYLRIPLLESPSGPVVAELEQRRDQYGTCQAFLLQDNESVRLWRGWDFPEISYESSALAYFEARDGFAKVLQHTMPPGLWVRMADMPGERLRPWTELFVERERLYLAYDGHQLRSEPSESSEVLVSLRDRQVHEADVHRLIPTGQLSGDWGEFDVVEFTSDFYVLAQTREAFETGNRWRGWLRLINGDGLPAFWFFTRD
jgi:hypothetical protein